MAAIGQVALLVLLCTVSIAPVGAGELARFKGTWIKKNAPGIGTWIRMEVDAERPTRVILSWAAPFVAADAQGQYGANVVWRNESTSCWYDMRRAGTELTLRLTRGDPPGVCLQDSLFGLEDVPSPPTPPARTGSIDRPRPPDPASAPVTECDRLAAMPDYAAPGAAGVRFAQIDPHRAVPACREAVAAYPDEPRLQAWLGRALSKSERYEEGRNWLERAAAKGSLTAMNTLGFLYDRGQGVPQDSGRARSWYERAAEKGYPVAMTNLGHLYANGQGVPRDYRKARSWYARAAEKGDPEAMSSLGALYADGQGGVPQDYGKARSWYARAAEKGDPVAMYGLAILFDQGQGVAKNPRTAARRLLASARAGDTRARADLDGDMHSWTEDTVKAAQELLAASGDYTGLTDGNWGAGSRAAARAYYTRRN